MTCDTIIGILAPGAAATTRLIVVRGLSREVEIALIDADGEPIPSSRLIDAAAELLVRLAPDDVSNVLRFSTADTPTSLLFEPGSNVIKLVLSPSDTSSLALLEYFWRLQVSLPTGEVLDAIAWSPFDLTLGGASPTPPPPFDNTVKVNHDYQLPDALTYITPGGSPIENAQIRVYAKADYDAGRLDAPIAVTTTDAAGHWRDSVLVAPGYTYVVRFEKPYEYGPNVQEIFA